MTIHQIESAYIITLKNHLLSENLAKRCYESCAAFDMPAKKWDAFDGTSGQNIVVPKHLQHEGYIKFLRPLNLKLSTTEIACVLSHFSLWCHCIVVDKPITILEHDVIIVKEIKYHKNKNTINYLGYKEQYENNSIQTPPCFVSIEGYNYTFMRGAVAYSIDPSVARSLVSYVIKEGITKPTDVLIRSDYFSVHQDDIYAYNTDEHTTIHNRQLFQEL